MQCKIFLRLNCNCIICLKNSRANGLIPPPPKKKKINKQLNKGGPCGPLLLTWEPLIKTHSRNCLRGERTEPRILNFNKQKSQKGARRKSFGLIVINNCLRDFLFVPLYSFNLNSVSKLLVWSGTLPHKKKWLVRFRAKIHHLTPSESP